MADKNLENTIFAKVMEVCCQIREALEKEDFQALDGLFIEREGQNKAAATMSRHEIETIIACDREIVGNLERKRALIGTGISEVRRARKTLETLKMTRSGSSLKRRVAVSA